MPYYSNPNRGESVDSLRRRRIELNAELRQATLVRNAIPHLGQTKPLRDWRLQFTRPYDSTIRRVKMEIRSITSVLGPPIEPFKLRKCSGLARIAQQYDPLATPLLPHAQSIYFEEQARMQRELEARHGRDFQSKYPWMLKVEPWEVSVNNASEAA